MLSVFQIIMLSLSVVALLSSVTVLVLFFTGAFKYKASWTFQPAYLIAAALFFVAEFAALLPVSMLDTLLNNSFEIVFNSLYSSLRSFAVDVDTTDILSLLKDYRWLQFYVAFFFLSAPMITVGALLSLLKDYFASIRMKLSKNNDNTSIYIFSKLSIESLTLAEDIREKTKEEISSNKGCNNIAKWNLRRTLRNKMLIAFCDVTDNLADENSELLDRAYELDALVLKKDMTSLKMFTNIKPVDGKKESRKKIWFFAMDNDERENETQTLTLVNRMKKILDNKKNSVNYLNIPNIKFFVFSDSDEGGKLFEKALSENIKNFAVNPEFDGLIIRVNETRSLVYNRLYNYGSQMFVVKDKKDADSKPLSKNHITVQERIKAVVIGLGGYGSEMVKALAWYCRMNRNSIQIDVFDKNREKFSQLEYRCPSFFAKENNGAVRDEIRSYEINFHKGCEVFSKRFEEEFKKLSVVDYVLVALGSDEDNIEAALQVRMVCERMGIHPKIEAVVYDTDRTLALRDMCSGDANGYDIYFIGDIKSCYSCKNILMPQLNKEAKTCHDAWARTIEDKHRFYISEYDCRSSQAVAIRNKARGEMGYTDMEKYYSDGVLPENQIPLDRLEHIAWWEWMLTEGFIYSETRNNLAKLHNCMKPFAELDLGNKDKDNRVANATKK